MAADWRDALNYARLHGIDRAGLMWEWLRRDPRYVAWYIRASTATRAGSNQATPRCNGGFTFAEWPEVEAPDAWLLWHADLDPGTLRLIAGPIGRGDPDAIDPALMAPWLRIVRDRQVEHAVLSDGWHHIRLDIEQGSLPMTRSWPGRASTTLEKNVGVCGAENFFAFSGEGLQFRRCLRGKWRHRHAHCLTQLGLRR